MIRIVSNEEALLNPYPIVWVNDDGSVRELHEDEHKPLECEYEPGDGARLYVKDSYASKDGWGSIKGYCYRIYIPDTTKIQAKPDISPNHEFSEEELLIKIKKLEAQVEKEKKSWWQFWKR